MIQSRPSHAKRKTMHEPGLVGEASVEGGRLIGRLMFVENVRPEAQNWCVQMPVSLTREWPIAVIFSGKNDICVSAGDVVQRCPDRSIALIPTNTLIQISGSDCASSAVFLFHRRGIDLVVSKAVLDSIFELRSGAGRVLGEYVEMTKRVIQEGLDPDVERLLYQQLSELFIATFTQAYGRLSSKSSQVRTAHLNRVEAYVRSNLFDDDLTPHKIANDCGISIRYLHAIFSDTGKSISSWIRDWRLQAAYDFLSFGKDDITVAEIAHKIGFSDQAQFSNAFRRRFGRTPSSVMKLNVNVIGDRH